MIGSEQDDGPLVVVTDLENHRVLVMALGDQPRVVHSICGLHGLHQFASPSGLARVGGSLIAVTVQTHHAADASHEEMPRVILVDVDTGAIVRVITQEDLTGGLSAEECTWYADKLDDLTVLGDGRIVLCDTDIDEPGWNQLVCIDARVVLPAL